MRFILLCSLPILTACTGGPIVGGPCSYEESVIEARVVGVEDGLVEMSSAGADYTFMLDVDDFDAPPAPGTRVALRRERITEGTCTPEIYTILD